MSRITAFLIALVAATNAFICFAQVEQGGISGVVLDATGASIPGAKVAAVNQATGTLSKTETTEDGYYRIPYLPAGKYNVSVEKDGFNVNRVSDIPVLVGQNSTI